MLQHVLKARYRETSRNSPSKVQPKATAMLRTEAKHTTLPPPTFFRRVCGRVRIPNHQVRILARLNAAAPHPQACQVGGRPTEQFGQQGQVRGRRARAAGALERCPGGGQQVLQAGNAAPGFDKVAGVGGLRGVRNRVIQRSRNIECE